MSVKTSDALKDHRNESKLPDGVKLRDLVSNFEIAHSEYTPVFRKAAKLDATDNGELWKAIGAKFPSYQILPDTNWLSYVKNNILASIYTVGKSAKLLPTSEKDKTIVEQLNIAMECIWSSNNVYMKQMQAGERAALLNYGLTQVGWDNSITQGTGDAFAKGEIILRNVNPLKFMRDPFASDIETASYCMTWEDYHESVLMSNPNYKAAFKEFVDNKKFISPAADIVLNVSTDKVSQSASGKQGYFRVYTHWVNDDGNIHEIHTLNNEVVLYVKESIKPSTFPFAELYCNLPGENLFGISECAKVFSNNVAYNVMSSIICTSEYKNQRPPRFISQQSQLNIAAFTKHGNDADRTFVVQGDASKAVHYHTFPAATQQAASSMSAFSGDIQTISGVDGRYTGRDTGSILTTGGVENMLDQVTMIDAPKVNNYEHYCKRLTQLILGNYLHHNAIKRKYYTQDARTLKWKGAEVDFPNIDADTAFNYEMSISSELPKNKSRIESVANHLMEMQMQYSGQGTEVDLITPQEWLMMQDLPMREFMQERMDIQRTRNWQETVAQVLTEYTGLVEQGMPTEQAMDVTAQTMSLQSQPGGEEAVAKQAEQIQQMMPQQAPQQPQMPMM